MNSAATSEEEAHRALVALKKLHDEGFVDDEEYTQRRQLLVDFITKTSLPRKERELPDERHTTDIPPNIKKRKFPAATNENVPNKRSHTEPLPVETLTTPPSTPPLLPSKPDELTFEEKVKLSEVIMELSAIHLRQILLLIKEKEPTSLVQTSDEYSFDLGVLSTPTLRSLQQYIHGALSANCVSLVPATTPNPQAAAYSPPFSTSCTTTDVVSTAAAQESLVDNDMLFNLLPATPPPADFAKEEGTNPTQDATSTHHPSSQKFKIFVSTYRLCKQADGPKPYICDACGHTFTDRSNLVQHIRLHTQEKPYHCEICGKAFAYSSVLKEHKNTHTEQKPFACPVEGCGKCFAQSSNLKRHLRVHTGDKPYVCPECNQAFSQSSNLKQHKAKMHPEVKQ